MPGSGTDSTKPSLLIVGEYNRMDFVDIFKDSRNHFNFFFIEYASRKEVQNDYYKKYGQAIFWGDYSCGQELLDTVKPHKVIFIFIETYHQVALNLACRNKGIRTYLIDHGIRDMELNVRLEHHLILQSQKAKPYPLHLKLSQFGARLKARLFLLNTIKRLPESEAAFMREYIRIRRMNSWIDTLKQVNSPFRLPDAYIAFSPRTFAVHQYYDHLSDDTKVHYIGIPSFNSLANQKQSLPEKNVLFIDQGLAERGLFGWTTEAHAHLLRHLSAAADSSGYNLYFKPHPKQSSYIKVNSLTIVNDVDITKLIPKISVVIGFASTYLLPLLAQPHTTVLTLENHPAGKLDVSKSFTDAGVAHPIYDLNELNNILLNIDELHRRQLPNKAKFTEEWMYKFDGKAGERLRDILLSDEV